MKLGVLLAGGQSRRMGRDKALIEVEGQPAWKHQLAKLEQCKLDQLWVSVRRIPDWPLPAACLFLPDVVEDCGPMGGLYSAFKQEDSVEQVLLMGIDMPSLPVRYLQSILDRAANGSGVAVKHGIFFEPLCSVYPRSVLADLEDAISSRHLGFQPLMSKWVADGRMALLDADDAYEQGFFENRNAPGDLPC